MVGTACKVWQRAKIVYIMMHVTMYTSNHLNAVRGNAIVMKKGSSKAGKKNRIQVVEIKENGRTS